MPFDDNLDLDISKIESVYDDKQILKTVLSLASSFYIRCSGEGGDAKIIEHVFCRN